MTIDDTGILLRLGAALAVGLLIGTERGWSERGVAEGRRVAGVRTFGLIALLGALLAVLGRRFDPLVLGLGAAGLAAVLAVAYWADSHRERDYGITTEVAALVTLALGALAMEGYLAAAAAAGVVTAALLGLKPRLHGWLAQIRAEELYGTFKLLLISVVLLPVLPDRGYGPWQALNPYALWWMVVLVAGISYAGYVAVRVAGAHRGLLLTALAGGLFASTVVALNYARYGRREPALAPVLAAGVVAASATMFPRVLLISGVIEPRLLPHLALPLGLMTAAAYGFAIAYWRGNAGAPQGGASLPVGNPFELAPALKFGLLLAVVMLAAEALRAWFGTAGLYALAAASGVSDVDAITLSLARLAGGELGPAAAARGILIASFVNTAVKAVLVAAIGSRGLGLRVAAAAVAAILAGAVTIAVEPVLRID